MTAAHVHCCKQHRSVNKHTRRVRTSVAHKVAVRRAAVDAVQRALERDVTWLAALRVLIGGIRVRAEIAQLHRRLDLETGVVTEHLVDALERVPQAQRVAKLVHQVVGRVRLAEILRLQCNTTCGKYMSMYMYLHVHDPMHMYICTCTLTVTG